MAQILEQTDLQNEQEPVLSAIFPATNEDIIAYLCQSYKIAEIAAMAEHNALVLGMCEQLGITVSEEELQAAGDTFRHENKLLGASETLEWLQQQRITVEDWSAGITIELLTNKLKEHLFGDAVDTHYIDNRNDYQRVALSQILVGNLPDALKVIHALRAENASFCTLAILNSQGQKSQQNGGFVGIRFISELLPEIAQAIAEAKEGEVIGPIQTKLGYHILRIEKWFSAEMSEIREQILESLFQIWLRANSNSHPTAVVHESHY